jgi:hypothetical protein
MAEDLNTFLTLYRVKRMLYDVLISWRGKDDLKQYIGGEVPLWLDEAGQGARAPLHVINATP